MKQITSTLTIALLLSAPCAMQAGKKGKRKTKASTQNASLTFTGTAAGSNMLTQAETAFADTNSNDIDEESTPTDITSTNNHQDTLSEYDQLMIQRNDAQLLMNRKYLDIIATKQALLVTQKTLEEERLDLARSSFEIWKLSAKIKALQNPRTSNETTQPTSGSNNPFNDQQVHTLQETLVAFYDKTTGITTWKTPIKNDNGDIIEEYVDTGSTSMGSPSSSSSSSSSHNNNNNNNNNNNSMPAPATASTSTWLWSILGYNTTK